MRLVLPVVMSVSALLWGCGPECTPEPDITVTLDPDVEEVRAVPMLASGQTSLLGIDVPDAHGDVSFNVRIQNAPSVIIDSFNFEQQVDGAARDVSLVRTRHNEDEFEATDEAFNQGKFRFHWRVRKLAEYLLPEGKSHTSKVTMNWRYAGCRTQTGVATVDIPGTIKSPNVVKNFVLSSAEAGRVDVLKGGKAKMVLQSNWPSDVINQIAQPKFRITFFDEGIPPVLGLALASPENIALQVNGQPKRMISSGESLEVYTYSNPSVGGAPYDHAGQGASTSTLVGGGKALVTLEIQSVRGSGSTVTDVINTLVDVP